MQTNDFQNVPATTAEVDELLRRVERELGAHRQARGQRDSRAAFRVGSLVFIIGAAIAALSVLQWMVWQLPQPEHRSAVSEQAENKK